MELEDLIKKAQARLDSAKPQKVADVEVEGQEIEIFARPLPRTQWQDLKARHPMREAVLRDLRTDYNIDAVAREYPAIHVVVDGEEDSLVRFVEGQRVSLWPSLYDTLPGEVLDAIAATIWGMNDSAALGKVSAGE